MHVCACVHMCVCVCVCACVHMCVCMCVCVLVLTVALSTLRKTPVDSTTYNAPESPHGISAGFILTRETQDEQCAHRPSQIIQKASVQNPSAGTVG